MILSVSRRTDIPAFYSDWFFNRLREGVVYVRNPMNFHQVSKVTLNPAEIDCIVFWTKNPGPLLRRLDLLLEYKYYFQITLTPYDWSIEKHVPDKELILKAFQSLAKQIGPKRTIWRYDPIIFTEELGMEYHLRNFEHLAANLAGSTELCVISFLNLYKKTERNMQGVPVLPVKESVVLELGGRLVKIARKYGIRLEACSEEIDLSAIGITPAHCIDPSLIAEILGEGITLPKDKNQRAICGCAASVDIGAYNSCSHGCLYCYANYSDIAVKNSVLRHDPKSPLLIGHVDPLEDRVTLRKSVPLKKQKVIDQLTFEGM